MQRNTSSRRNQWGISKQGPQAGKNQLCPTTTGSCEKDILGKTRAAALLPACKLFRVKSHGLFVSVLPGLSTVLPATDPWSVFSVSQPTACTATLAGSGPPDALPIMTKEGWQTGHLLVTDTCEHGADLDSWPESQHRGRSTSMPAERHLNVRWHRWHRGPIRGLRKRHRYSPCSPHCGASSQAASGHHASHTWLIRNTATLPLN